MKGRGEELEKGGWRRGETREGLRRDGTPKEVCHLIV